MVLTEHAGHGRELARRALDDGIELVVAVGGDGTMNEIASVLSGTPATFGLIPCGSGNGLGRQLGIHGSVSRALEILDSGRTVLIDSGTADGHPFFCVAGLGFEAELAARFNRLSERGFLRYLSTGATLWREYRPIECSIIKGNHRDTVTAFTVAVANAAQYGNNAFIAPGAELDDGLLNLTLLPPVGLIGALPLLRRMFAGTLGGHPRVRLHAAAQFEVERPAAGLLHTDGETHQAGATVIFEVRPASLRIKVPASR